MILCVYCGHQNKGAGNFCTHCGNRLSETPYIVGRLQVLGAVSEKQEHLISEVERFIGRDVANDVVINDEEISSWHSKISFADQAFWVEDLGTTNGTFVNGQRIQELTQLKNEDLIKIGRTILQFRV
jgi:pSer/pThr/pTyr-binding forkhead associated (FHA) protein